MQEEEPTVTQPTVAAAFYDVVKAHGITRIFGNPGSNELTMLKHLPDDIEYVLALQEGAAVAMADGYAQASSTVGFVNLHASSGAGNAMGNLTNSAAGHVPLVILAGQQSRQYVPLNAMLTNVSATQLYTPLAKAGEEPLRAEDTPLLTSKCILLAGTAPRGPVFLSVPLDDWARPASADMLTQLVARKVPGSPVVDDAGIEAIAEAVASAQNPVLVVGPGVDDERGWAATVRLAEAQGLPVWVAPSPSRAPFPTRHPHFRGALPTGLGAVADTLQGHDLILTLGAAVFRYHQFVDGDLLPAGARLIGVTSDPDEAARSAVGTLYVGDPSHAAERLSQSVPTRTFAPLEPLVLEPATAGARAHSAASILDAVNRAKGDDAVVVLEWTSADQLWPRLDFTRAQSYYFPASGGLGWGMPAAIGVAMAVPERPVVALIGDGAMQYTPAALWTAAKYRVPVTFVVCRNGEYGALQRFSKLMDVPDAEYLDLPGIDPVSIARGYGVESHEVETLDELEEFVRGARNAQGPRLVVVKQESQR